MVEASISQQGKEIQSLHLDEENTDRCVPKISTHSFSASFQETHIYFLATKLGTALMIWIGGADGNFNELAYSAKTPYDKTVPLATQLITAGNPTSRTMAAKLSKKLEKPVFVSFNIPETLNGSLLQSIQIRLLEEIEKQPSKF